MTGARILIPRLSGEKGWRDGNRVSAKRPARASGTPQIPRKSPFEPVTAQGGRIPN